MDNIGSTEKFDKVNKVSQRAKQLIRGAKKLVDIRAGNPLTIAIKEFEEGLITEELLAEPVETKKDFQELIAQEVGNLSEEINLKDKEEEEKKEQE